MWQSLYQGRKISIFWNGALFLSPSIGRIMDYSGQQDDVLMKRYQGTDLVAFETLYHRHKGKAYGYLVKRLKDPALADEVFQNAFIKLHRKRHQYNPNLSFLNWFFIILRSEMLDYLRKQKPVEEEFREESVLVPEPSPSYVFNLATVGSLSKKEKEFLQLRYLQEWSFEDLSKKFKTTQVNARKIISRSLKKLRKEIGSIKSSH
ncbi:MAG: hypothetical protein CME64_09085 [Halobacteriovoraceae bacterium]|nr:hypothetical protein [Halobacteriovoraceae bacterium]